MEADGKSMFSSVILAAGLGSRLGDRTKLTPKCLTPVQGTPILQRALGAITLSGSNSVRCVLGHLSGAIEEAVASWGFGTDVKFVRNDAFAETGTAASLRIGLEGLHGPVLIVEGDVVFDREIVDRLLQAPQDATAVVPMTDDLEGSYVIIDSGGAILRWVHATMPEHARLCGQRFKTVNLTLVRSAHALKYLTDVLATLDPVHSLEYTFDELVRSAGCDIQAVDVSDLRWAEIDNESDLRVAEELFSGECT